MKSHDIHIMPTGRIEGVQQDALDLSEIGHVTNERASTVEWDEKQQLWIATIKPKFRFYRKDCGTLHQFASRSRQKCIDWEVSYLNNSCENSQNNKRK